MPVVRVMSWEDPRLADYRNVRDPQLLREGGVFIAESREVVRLMLCESSCRLRSFLLNSSAYESLADQLSAVPQEVPIFLAGRGVFARVLGHDIHRGCLAAAQRPPSPSLESLWPASGPALVVVLDGVANPDNIGSILRNALAFGADAVVLGPGCADPYYRKAIRTSMGAVFRVAHTTVSDWSSLFESLARGAFQVKGLAPDACTPIDALASRRIERLALVVGNEGAGLSDTVRAWVEEDVRIPMRAGVDSVNVATATGIALYVAASWRPGIGLNEA